MRAVATAAAVAAVLTGAPVVAQVSVSGTTRVRVETIGGQPRAGFDQSDTLLNFSTTVAAQYEDGPVEGAAPRARCRPVRQGALPPRGAERAGRAIDDIYMSLNATAMF
ncbi:hypothetical protein K7957_15085 [Sphingomonas yunnanensis]|uniref:hypothetical protein n=1 Tax=Sphingomonas yunnanensis TaxID=310400 RepID=UPI001CA625DB|nr:hypothetical protein [Sphingomonas yunnanensis]MBY9064263.1 hypothetical protein [Sphingomonas yunnanensis]